MKTMILFLSLCFSAQASIVYIPLTNWFGTTATNHVKITPVADTPLIDGSYIQTGIPKNFTPVNGIVTNVMNGGNYQLDIAGMTYLHALYFSVPSNDTNTYNITNLVVSGGNFFNYYPGILSVSAGNGVAIDPPNGMGHVTVTITASDTNSIWPVAGTNASLLTNGSVVVISVVSNPVFTGDIVGTSASNSLQGMLRVGPITALGASNYVSGQSSLNGVSANGVVAQSLTVSNSGNNPKLILSGNPGVGGFTEVIGIDPSGGEITVTNGPLRFSGAGVWINGTTRLGAVIITNASSGSATRNLGVDNAGNLITNVTPVGGSSSVTSGTNIQVVGSTVNLTNKPVVNALSVVAGAGGAGQLSTLSIGANSGLGFYPYNDGISDTIVVEANGIYWNGKDNTRAFGNVDNNGNFVWGGINYGSNFFYAPYITGGLQQTTNGLLMTDPAYLCPVPILAVNSYYNMAGNPNGTWTTNTIGVLTNKDWYRYGWSNIWYDAGALTNRVGGHLTYSTAAFPNGLSGPIAYAHSNGFNFGLYLAHSPIGCVGEIGTSDGDITTDMADLLLLGVDMVKIDSCGGNYGGLSYSTADNRYEQRHYSMFPWINDYLSHVYSRRPMMTLSTQSSFRNPSGMYGPAFELAYYNMVEDGIGAGSAGFGGAMTNFIYYQKDSWKVKPGHTHHLAAQDGNSAVVTSKEFLAMAALEPSSVIVGTNINAANSVYYTNPAVLNAIRNPLVLPGYQVASNGTTLCSTFARPLSAQSGLLTGARQFNGGFDTYGGATTNLIAIENLDASSHSVTVTWGQIGLASNTIVNVTNIWAGGAVVKATNFFTDTVLAGDINLYRFDAHRDLVDDSLSVYDTSGGTRTPDGIFSVTDIHNGSADNLTFLSTANQQAELQLGALGAGRANKFRIVAPGSPVAFSTIAWPGGGYLLFKTNNGTSDVEIGRMSPDGSFTWGTSGTDPGPGNVYFDGAASANAMTNRGLLSASSLATDANGKLISGGAGGGTVTSVALSAPTTGLTVSGSPVTTSGTLALVSPSEVITNGATQVLKFGGQTTSTNGFLVKSNGWLDGTALIKGDIKLVSSNGTPYIIASDPVGALTTNAIGGTSVGGSGWSTTGNSGLATDGSAFLGTTDAKPIFIKSDGTTVGWVTALSTPATAGPDIVFGGGTGTLTNTITSKVASGSGSFIAGGNQNLIQGSSDSGIFSGAQQTLQTNVTRGVLVGGSFSILSSNTVDSGIFAGTQNRLGVGATVIDSAIIAGFTDTNSANYSVVLGGQQNAITAGQNSVIGGFRSKLSHGGVFMFSDSQNSDFTDFGQDSISIRASGGEFQTGAGAATFAVTTNSILANGGTVYVFASSNRLSGIYIGTNAPGKGNGTDIANGAIGGTNLVQIDSPVTPKAFVIDTNGLVSVSVGINANNGPITNASLVQAASFQTTNPVTGNYSVNTNGFLSLIQSNNVATSPVGLNLSNNVIATSGNPKASPILKLSGSTWDSTAGAAKEESFVFGVIPTSAAGGGGYLVISNVSNGVLVGEVARFSQSGGFVMNADSAIKSGGSLSFGGVPLSEPFIYGALNGGINLRSTTPKIQFQGAGSTYASGGGISWSQTAADKASLLADANTNIILTLPSFAGFFVNTTVTATNGFIIPKITNGRAGQTNLVAGTITIANTSVASTDLLFIQRKTAGGTLGAGGFAYTLSAGTSLTINSVDLTGVLSTLDTSLVGWVLIANP